MTYFIVKDGAIQEAFDSRDEASARADELAGSVVGDLAAALDALDRDSLPAEFIG